MEDIAKEIQLQHEEIGIADSELSQLVDKLIAFSLVFVKQKMGECVKNTVISHSETASRLGKEGLSAFKKETDMVTEGIDGLLIKKMNEHRDGYQFIQDMFGFFDTNNKIAMVYQACFETLSGTMEKYKFGSGLSFCSEYFPSTISTGHFKSPELDGIISAIDAVLEKRIELIEKLSRVEAKKREADVLAMWNEL